jgi:hypothetical protein
MISSEAILSPSSSKKNRRSTGLPGKSGVIEWEEQESERIRANQEFAADADSGRFT